MRRFVFLARPRRFGKSLLCNTFKAYFQGKKQLFEGLNIMEFEKGRKTYPVLHFDKSDLKNYSIPEAKSNLEGLLRTYEAMQPLVNHVRYVFEEGHTIESV